MKNIVKVVNVLLKVLMASLIISCQPSISSNNNQEFTGQASEEQTEKKFSITEENLVVKAKTKSIENAESVKLKLQATGIGTLSYQWFCCDDEAGSNAVLIEGATSSTYETGLIFDEGIKYYYCEVKDCYTENSESENSEVVEQSLKSKIFSVEYKKINNGIPVIYINTEDEKSVPSDKSKINAKMTIFENDIKVYDCSDKNFGGKNEENIQIKIRGNATAGYPKKPYKIKLPKKYNLIDGNTDFDCYKSWVLLAGYCDKTLLRTSVGFFVADLFNTLDDNQKIFVPNSKFCDVVLNGKYIGNYLLTDSVEEGKDRVPVNEKDTDEGGIGYIFERDGYYMHEPDYFKSLNADYYYTFKFPDTGDVNFSSYKNYLSNFINEFEESLKEDYSGTKQWAEFIDIESFARWFLIQNITGNLDPNPYAYIKSSSENDKIIMGPVWDFEWSLGIGWYYDKRPRKLDEFCFCWEGWYYRDLLKKQEFVDELKKQWQKLTAKYSSLAYTITAEMDKMALEIEKSSKENFEVWQILNEQISVGGIPLGSYQAELECDKKFVEQHIAWLNGKIQSLTVEE